MTIERAAVIGAGTMGSGIAAHIANAGVPVVLLDIVPGAAASAIDRMLKADPAPLMHKSFARRFTPGTLPDDLGLVADADWVVEAVIEKTEVKRDLFAALETVRKPGSAISSNTSTIPLAVLTEGRSAGFAADFLITHFFNPPRYMRLLEIVAGPQSKPETVEMVADFADRRLGKGVVRCKDTPGFVANRIGAFWLECAINAALDHGLTVEEADAVAGRPMGIPKTGIFGLLDLIGLDVMPHVSGNLLAHLPADDPFSKQHRDWPLLTRLIESGHTGRKGKGGFYRLVKTGGTSEKQGLDLVSGDYRPSEKPKLEGPGAKGDLAALIVGDDKFARFARTVLTGTLGYAASLVPEIADDVPAVDAAMRLGYNWKHGPFEMIDRLGVDRLAELLTAEGRPVPPLLEKAAGKAFYRVEGGQLQSLMPLGMYMPVPRPGGVLLLSDVKRAGAPVRKNGSASVWDLGDGALCFEFTSKMNSLDTEIMTLFAETIALIAAADSPYKALVIHNDGENFSVGANLGMAMFVVNIALWDQIDALIRQGQDLYRHLRDAPFPVVAAPAGMALGGGCELLMHCDAVQAHAETYVGLVEAGVGLLPAWGGSKEMLIRHAGNPKRPGGPMPPVSQAFETIGLAKVAKSAFEARDLLFLRPSDGITMNRDRLLFDAKQKALALADGYRPPAGPEPVMLPGPSGQAALKLMVNGLRLAGKATPHDAVVAESIGRVLTGADTDPTETMDEQAILDLEREEFLRLIKTPATIARIEHMLNTGKPLRN